MSLGLNYGLSKKVIFPHTIDFPHRSPTKLVGLSRHFGGVTVNADRRKV
jgi:hypothetical protein